MFPAVPWIGSMTTTAGRPATSSSMTRRSCLMVCSRHSAGVPSNRLGSAKGARWWPAGRGPTSVFQSTSEIGSTPAVLPWKPPVKPTTSVRRVNDRAKPDSSLDGLGAAAEKLRARQIPGRELCHQPDELGARLRGEAADRHSFQLRRKRGDILRMGVSETCDRDASVQIEIGPSVEVGQRRPTTVGDGQLRQERDRLQPGSDELLLVVEERFRSRLERTFDFSWHGHAE